MGFYSELHPDIFAQEGEYIRARHKPKTVFLPAHIGVPISNNIYTALTVNSTQQQYLGSTYTDLPRTADLNSVVKLWLTVARDFQIGALDKYIIPENKLYLLSN
jgi:hypothetical protein